MKQLFQITWFTARYYALCLIPQVTVWQMNNTSVSSKRRSPPAFRAGSLLSLESPFRCDAPAAWDNFAADVFLKMIKNLLSNDSVSVCSHRGWVELCSTPKTTWRRLTNWSEREAESALLMRLVKLSFYNTKLRGFIYLVSFPENISCIHIRSCIILHCCGPWWI